LACVDRLGIPADRLRNYPDYQENSNRLLASTEQHDHDGIKTDARGPSAGRPMPTSTSDAIFVKLPDISFQPEEYPWNFVD